MLDSTAFAQYGQTLNLSHAALELIQTIRSSEPVRRVQSRVSNVCGRYPSRKMGRVIQAESRTVELVACSIPGTANSSGLRRTRSSLMHCAEGQAHRAARRRTGRAALSAIMLFVLLTGTAIHLPIVFGVVLAVLLTAAHVLINPRW